MHIMQNAGKVVYRSVSRYVCSLDILLSFPSIIINVEVLGGIALCPYWLVTASWPAFSEVLVEFSMIPPCCIICSRCSWTRNIP